MRGARWRRLAAHLSTHAVLLVLAALMVAPMAWMLSTSLKVGGQRLTRGVEWMPWQDRWLRDGDAVEVLVLKARVRPEGRNEVIEVGITSLDERAKVTEVSVPEGRYMAEVIELQVRPRSEEDTVLPAEWVPFDAVETVIDPHWENYSKALREMKFWALLKNTIAITFLGTLGTLLSSSFVAYGFARYRFPLRGVLFMVLLSGLMLPPVVTMIPVYLIFRQLGWIDTLLPLFVPAWFGINAFAVFLFRQYFMTVPFDLDDAATIDGCGPLRIYWDVLLPLSKPVLATVAIFSFTGYWLDFMTPLIYLNTQLKYTLALGLYAFKGPYTVEWEYLMAATLVVSAPCVVLFLFGQRFFMRGVVMSGLKT